MPSLRIADAIQRGISFRDERERRDREQALLAGLSASQDILNDPQFAQLAATNPQAANQLAQLAQARQAANQAKTERFNALSAARKKSMAADTRTANQLLQQGKTDAAARFLSDRMNSILEKDPNADVSDTGEILTLIGQGDIAQAQELLDVADLAFTNQGLLKQIQPQNKEFRKEERAAARKTVDNFDKRASDIRSAFGKIDSLVNKPKEKLSRTDVSAAITSLARLVSPGIVTDKDFQSLVGTGGSFAEISAALTGRGGDFATLGDQLQRAVDPTNPDLFNQEAFLTTARSVASAEVPALIDQFQGARDRAINSGLSEQAIVSIFDKNRNRLALNELLNVEQPTPTTTNEFAGFRVVR